MDPTKLMSKSSMIGAAQQDMMWHTAPPNTPQAHGAVSVVTTVYSNVPAYPGPPQSFNTATLHQNSGPNVFGVGGGTTNIPQFGAPPGSATKPTTYSGDGSYTPYDQGYSTTGAPDYAPTVPQQAALNAAQVAAAAVATATATAVAIDPSQFHQQYHPGSQATTYTNGPYPPQMGVVPPGPYGANPRGIQQRGQVPSPYIPAVRTARSQNSVRYPSAGVKGPPAATGGYPNGQQQPAPAYLTPYPGGQQPMPTANQRPMMQNSAMYPQNMGSSGGYNPRLSHTRSPHYPMHQSTMVSQGNSIPNGYPPQHATYGHQVIQQIPAPSYEQHVRSNPMYGTMTALPNNPTPPLTPAVSGVMVPPPGYPGAAGNLNGPPPPPVVDIKPVVNVQGDDPEPRITFPVRDGILLTPFRLEHNAPVSQHVFLLDDRIFHLLCTNPNYDLQLKCFHAEDKTMSNNWPNNANIQICVNGTPVAVRMVERPLYIKSLCQKQKNTLQIAVQQCCCSHLFILSLVNRLTVETVSRQLVRTRLLSADHCIEKIRSFFHSGEAAQMRNAEGGGTNNEVMPMSINMSLKCPITMKKIDLPARGQDCRHTQCFDLKSYLEMNKERSTWLCPICKRLAPCESLEIDQYVWGILTNLSGCDVDEVTIDGAAAWKPLNKPSTGGAMKDESDVPCNSAKRFKPDPGASGGNVCPWNQSNMQQQPTPAQMGIQSMVNVGQHQNQAATAGANGSASLYNRSTSVLSPHFTSGSPGSAFGNANPATPVSCHPHAPGANGLQSTTPNFSSPNTPRQSMGPMTPHNSRCGPATPMTPQQLMQNQNPPSVGPPPRSVGNPPSVDNQNKGIHGSSSTYNGGQRQQSLQQQSSVDASFAGSAPYTPISVSSAGSQQGTNNITNTSTGADGGSDFPDFTFDTSDLLGGGDATQTGAALFNDPEELMKYLADDTDFGGFSFSGQNNAGMSNSLSTSVEQRRSSQSMNASFNNTTKFSSSSNQQQNNGYGFGNGAATAAEMDDILSLLDK